MRRLCTTLLLPLLLSPVALLGQTPGAASTKAIDFLGADVTVPADTIELPAESLGQLAIHHPMPQYVAPSARDWPFGQAQALLLIDAAGNVERVLASTGSDKLATSLVAAVQGWRFQPIAAGRPQVHRMIRVDALFRAAKDATGDTVTIAALAGPAPVARPVIAAPDPATSGLLIAKGR